MDATAWLLLVLLLSASTVMSIVALASVSGLRAQVKAFERQLARLSPATTTVAAPPFLVYGVMCTVVGYLAPAPPRTNVDPRPA